MKVELENDFAAGSIIVTPKQQRYVFAQQMTVKGGI